MAQYFLEVCYVESSYFANELKTIVVCSALAVARFVLLEEPWPDTAEEVTGVTNYQLLECSREMFHVVSKEQSCPVMSPVYQKYSTPHVRKLSLLFNINNFFYVFSGIPFQRLFSPLIFLSASSLRKC